MNRNWIVLWLCLAGSGGTWAQKTELRIAYPPDGISLGQGWHTIPGKAADAYCVEFAPPEGGGAQVVYTNLREVHTNESVTMHQTSGLDANVKSVFDFTNKRTDTLLTVDVLDHKTFWVAARVENSPQTIAPPQGGEPLRLKERYVEMLKTGADGVQRFLRECGDTFAYRRAGGAELTALSTISSLSMEEQLATKLDLGGGGQIGGFSLTVSNSTMTDVKKKALVEQMVFKYTLRGGNSSSGAANRDGLVELVRTLPTLAAGAAQYWALDVRTYASLINFPAAVTLPTAALRAGDTLKQYLRAKELADYTSYALSNPARFEPRTFRTLKLKEIEADARQRMTRLQAAINLCVADNSGCEQLAAPDTAWDYELRVHLPVRKSFTDLMRQIDDAAATKAAAEVRVDQIWRNKCKFAPGGYAPSPELTELQVLCKKVIPESQEEIDRLMPKLGADLRAAVKTVHLRAIRDERCLLDPLGPLCISQAELDALAAKVDQREFEPYALRQQPAALSPLRGR